MIFMLICQYLCLLRHNRHKKELNALFAQAHPTFLHFWTVIEELSRKRATLCRDVRQGKVKVPKRDRFEIAVIPGSYKSYKPKK